MPDAAHAHASASFSLDDWYTSLAPLQEKQRLSVSRVSAWAASKEATAVVPPAATPPPPSHVRASIEAAIDTMDALWVVQHDAQHEVLQNAVGDLDALVSANDTSLAHMAQLRQALDDVEGSAQELVGQTDALTKEGTHMEELYEQVALRLSYFSVLTHATSLLASATDATVETPAFLSMLQRLDLAMQFMQTHPTYRDAHVYQMRLGQCVGRMVGMLRHQFTERGVACTETATASLHETQQAGNAAPKLLLWDSAPLLDALYTTYTPLLSAFPPLFHELATFQAPTSAPTTALVSIVPTTSADEYHAILQECQKTYCHWRESLTKETLRLFFEEHARRSATTAADPSGLSHAQRESMRDAIGFVHGIACLEVRMFARLFSLPTEESSVHLLLRSIGDQVLAFFSTVIGPADTPPVLAGTADLFQTVAPPNPPASLAAATPAPDPQAEHAVALVWTQPILQALCSWLVRSAEAVVQARIAKFTPGHDDLLYPQCLLEQQEALLEEQAALVKATRETIAGHAKRASVVGAGLLESLVGTAAAPPLFTQPSRAIYASWYTPVRTALDLLAEVHTHIPLPSFVELGIKTIDAAQEATKHAASLLREGKYGAPDGGVGAVDGSLFQLRHLFVLRELLLSVQIASRAAQGSGAKHPTDLPLGKEGRIFFGVRAADASLVVDTLHSLWDATRSLVADRRTRPPVEEEVLQATLSTKLDRLQGTIGDVIAGASQVAATNVTLPLQIYMKQREAHASEPFSPAKAVSAWETFQQSVRIHVGELHEKIHVYIGDEATARHLAEGAVAEIRKTYTAYTTHVASALGPAVDDEPTAVQTLRTLQTPSELDAMLLERLLPS